MKKILLVKLEELKQFVERQSQFYAFRKYSYPYLSRWIEEVKQILVGDGNEYE